MLVTLRSLPSVAPRATPLPPLEPGPDRPVPDPPPAEPPVPPQPDPGPLAHSRAAEPA